MAEQKITVDLDLNTQDAKDELQKMQGQVGKDLVNSFSKLGESVEGANKEIQELSKETKEAADSAKTGFSKVSQTISDSAQKAKASFAGVSVAIGAAIGIAGALSAAVLKLGNDFKAQFGKEQTALILGGFEDGAKSIQEALDNTLTRVEALQKSAKFAAAGFDTSESQKELALLTKALAAVGQTTVDIVEEQLRAGEITGLLGDKYSELNPKIQAAISAFEAQNNVVASSADKFRISSQVIQGQLGSTITKINDINQPDIFAQISAASRQLKDNFVKEFGPSIVGVVDSVANAIPKITSSLKGALSFISNIPNSIADAIAPTSTLGKSAALDLAIFLDSAKNNIVSLFSGTSKEVDKQKKLIEKPIDGKKLLGNIEKEVKDAERVLDGLFQKQQQIRARQRALALQEASEEIKGFQSDARRQVRNFSQVLFNNVASLGGSFSGVIAAQKDFFEQSRILTSQFGKGLFDIIKLRDEEIVRLQKIGKLSSSQAKAALLLRTIQQAGSFDARERVLNETAINSQLKVAVSLLAADARLAQIRTEQSNLQKDVQANILTLTKTIIALQAQNTEQSRIAIKRNKDLLKVFQDIGKERAKILEAQKQLALAEREAQKQNLLLEAAKAQATALDDVRTKLLEIQKLQGQNTGISLISQNAQKNIRALQDDFKALNSQASVLQARIQTFNAIGDKEQSKILQEQLNSLNSQVFAKAQLLALTEQQADAEKFVFQLQKQTQEKQAAFQSAQALRDITKQIEAQQRLSQESLFGTNQLEQLRVQTSLALEDIGTKATTLRLRLQQLQAELAKGVFTEGRTQDQTTQQVSAIEAQIEALGRLRAATQEASQAQAQSLTLTGQLVKSFSQDSLNFTTNLAGQIKGVVGDLSSGVGGIIQGTFEGIVSGQQDILSNVGRQFLDVLSGMAAKLGSFFLTSGIAQQFVPPYTGAGAIAGGTALLALAGALKGASSLIAPVSTPSVSSGGGSSSLSSGSSPLTRAPGSNLPQEQQTPVVFNVAFNNRPWSKQTNTQEFQEIQGWFRDSSRRLGTGDPFALASSYGNRGR